MEKGEYVRITHFINPHLFWYQKCDGQDRELLEKEKIEQSLRKFFPLTQSMDTGIHYPLVGEIVAIYYVFMNKIVRARVEAIYKYTYKEDEFVVWSLDYGYPFQTNARFIRKITEDLEYYKQKNNILLGGIANILPAEVEFDYAIMKSRIFCKPLWMQRAVEDIQKLIKDAGSVLFIESFSVDGILQKQHFGDLKIVSRAGKAFFASEYLIRMNYALKFTKKFQEKVNTLQSIKIPCYLTNNRQYDPKYNNMTPFSIDYDGGRIEQPGKLSEYSCDKMFKQKVMDWNERNENYANMELLDRDLFYSTNTFDDADISFDDSVSLTSYCNRELEKKIENDTLNVQKAPCQDEMAMGLAGAQLKSRKTRYGEKNVPLPPTLDAFTINFDDKEEVSKPGDLNAVSSRTRALIELKKKREGKHLLKNQEEATKLKADAPNDTVAEVVQVTNVLSERMLKLKQLQKKYRKKSYSASDGSSTDINVDANCATLPLSSRAQHLLKIRQKYSKQTENVAHEAQKQSDSKISRQSDTKMVNVQSTESNVTNPQDPPSPLTDEIEDEKQKIQHLIHSNPYQKMTLVPGGFDLTNLVKRRNEDNHWHTKKTNSRGKVHIPRCTEQEQDLQLARPRKDMKKTGINSKSYKPDCHTKKTNSCGKVHIPRRTEQKQDSRLAKPRKEMKKTGITSKSYKPHLYDIVQDVLDTETNYGWVVSDYDEVGDIYSNSCGKVHIPRRTEQKQDSRLARPRKEMKKTGITSKTYKPHLLDMFPNDNFNYSPMVHDELNTEINYDLVVSNDVEDGDIYSNSCGKVHIPRRTEQKQDYRLAKPRKEMKKTGITSKSYKPHLYDIVQDVLDTETNYGWVVSDYDEVGDIYSNSCGKVHIPRRTEQEQDFRLARPRKEMKKTGITSNSYKPHLLDIVQDVLDTEINYDLVVSNDDEDGNINSTPLLENLDKKNQLIALSSVSEPKDNELKDSCFKFVQEENNVADTSREQLIQSRTSKGVGDTPLNLLHVKSFEKENLETDTPNSAMNDDLNCSAIVQDVLDTEINYDLVVSNDVEDGDIYSNSCGKVHIPRRTEQKQDYRLAKPRKEMKKTGITSKSYKPHLYDIVQDVLDMETNYGWVVSDYDEVGDIYSNSCGKVHIPRRTEQEQDFRLARPRKEMKKTGITSNSYKPHLLDIVQDVLDTEINYDLVVSNDDEDGNINSTPLLENLDKKNQLIALSSVSEPKDNELKDSCFKFVQEENNVADTSREQLIQSRTSKGVGNTPLNLLHVKSFEKENLETVTPNSAMAVKTMELESSSISSSSFIKLESITQKATNCNNDSNEAGSSSGCSGNIEKCQIAPKPKCESLSSSSTESFNRKQFHPLIKTISNSTQLPSSSSSSNLPESTNSLKESLPIKAPRLSCNDTKSSSSTRFPILSPSFSSYSQTKQINEALPEICNEVTHKTNLIEHLVLAHSNVTVTPIAGMTSAFFTPEIHQEMEKMRLTKMYRIQSYAWAHLVRGNSFFVINSQRSGKTWCYLPALCSMVFFRLESNGLPQTYGPVAVILAPTSCQVESISRQCRRLLTTSKIEVTTVPSYGIRNAEVVKIELHNGCGILVTTPPSLNRLLIANERENLFNMDRLQYLVIDELDTMMSQYSNFDETLNKFLEPFVHKQNNGKVPFQMVVTSRRWSGRMMSLLRISNQPLLCIADYLEAAVYAKAKLSIRLQGAEDKKSVMLDCLKKSFFNLERVMIICSTEDEVDLVEKCLIEDGYVCLTYTNRIAVDHSKLVDEWKVRTICNQILVVTDDVLPEIMVQNVWTLIHYSLPTTWTKFSFRFSCCLGNYENALASDFAKPTKVPQSLILLDEDNNLQLPRLVEFMEQHHQLKHVHPDILNVSARITAKREEARVEQGIVMCPNILEYGVCEQKNRCAYRHQLTKYDGPVDGIPTKGDLRVKILEVLSPTHYTARLLTHKQDDAWKVIRRSDEVTVFLMQLSLHFMNEEAQVIHWPLKVNDLCVYKGEGTFHRCRLLEVPPIPYENIVKQVNVKVKLIDSGSSIMCKSLYLLVIPEKFRDFPAQAVDIRLSGVIPYDNDRAWDMRSTRTVKKWIVTDVSEVDCLQACISFALMDTIWVDNVVLMEKLSSIRGYAIKTNVRRSLLGKNFGLADNTMHLVKKAAMQLGLLNLPKEKTDETPASNCEEEHDLLNFPSSSISAEVDFSHTEQTFNESAKKPVVRLAKETTIDSTEFFEKWMKLKLDELLPVKISQLNDPIMFYLRLLTNEEDFNELAEIIQVHEKIPLDDPYPIQNCLAPLDGKYYRAKIRRLIIDSTEAMVFFCDLGLIKNIPLEKLRCSSKDIVKHSPFQAICCKLTGLRAECVGEEIQRTIQLDGSVHFAYAVKEIFDNGALDDDFYIPYYEIILYECSTNKNDIVINKLLVERGLASYDGDTKHFLELEQHFDNEQGGAGNAFDFQDFLNRIQQQMDEEDCDDAPSRKYTKAEKKPNIYEKLKICEINPDTSMKNEESDSPDSRPPPLRALHKRPLTTWYETMCMIYLVIHAPDIADYHLEVTPKRLVFAAIVNGEKQVLILDFLGYVQPDRVTHEIRGLNVVVRLVKSLYMEWPRLLQDPTKFHWLTYNFNAIDAMEAEQMIEGRRHERSKARMLNDSSDSSVASYNSNLCETFTPIVNADDLQDPLEDF